jgi:hypothetical protein
MFSATRLVDTSSLRIELRDVRSIGISPDYNRRDVVIGEGVPPLTASPEALRGADDSYSDCSGPGREHAAEASL